jgi:hypothetical protein
MRTSCSIVLTLGVLSLATGARADIPPEPGYVEQCTLEAQQQAGQVCESCGDSWHGDVDACRHQWEPKGYALACRTRGASAWGEVWCKAGAPAKAAPRTAPVTPPPQSHKGCAIGPGGAAAAPSMSVLCGLAALGLLRRRRSSRAAPQATTRESEALGRTTDDLQGVALE